MHLLPRWGIVHRAPFAAVRPSSGPSLNRPGRWAKGQAFACTRGRWRQPRSHVDRSSLTTRRLFADSLPTLCRLFADKSPTAVGDFQGNLIMVGRNRRYASSASSHESLDWSQRKMAANSCQCGRRPRPGRRLGGRRSRPSAPVAIRATLLPRPTLQRSPC